MYASEKEEAILFFILFYGGIILSVI